MNSETLPGAEPLDAQTLLKIENKIHEAHRAHQPRTRHLRPDGSAKYTNRLFLSTSPYLLQHAHNPINWYPWGVEAFALAEKSGRPVLLSVGYSTCHWCHVMEEESFEDEEIARYVNENYVAIKVDREERPDVDAIYMAAVQAITGRGGWPMTLWLTPEQKPFYGGTYFPARDGDRGIRVGFLSMLRLLKETYDRDPERVVASSTEITEAIAEQLASGSGESIPDESALTRAAQFYRTRFDRTHGGQAGAPKFPSSLPIRFLLREYRRTQKHDLLDMATLTLKKMAMGGMYDHVAGGFHRYSTDELWLVPHFEKMLYDNALQVVAYLEAYQVTHENQFARVAQEILDYVARDMTSPERAFYSATDADSKTPSGHSDEGYFFTWTPSELDEILGLELSQRVQNYFDVTVRGNFEGRNILAIAPGQSDEAIAPEIDRAKKLLYDARNQRPQPLRDEKILTAWNGLMISAYARAGLVLNRSDNVLRAANAANFILQHMSQGGVLYRSYKDGQAQHLGYLDDYAFLIAGLLDLFEASGELRWLDEAMRLDVVLADRFEDRENGGFFMIGDGHEKLIAREKPAYDGAEPSGNSVALLNLLRLSELTANDSYRRRAEDALKAFSSTLTEQPMALSEMLIALDFYLDKPKEIAIVTPRGRKHEADAFLQELNHRFVPNRVLVIVEDNETSATQAKLIPWIEGKTAQLGKATAYVCERGICQMPTTEPRVFATQIKR